MTDSATSGTVHIVGAGLAGLSCAVALARADVQVELHEAARQAGGRCRSYFEPALDCEIDNGNHLVLSGNRALLDYVTTIGASAKLSGPAQAGYDFADLKSGERWALRISDGVIPWWLLSPQRRVPGTRLADYLGSVRLLRAGIDDTVVARLGDGPLYDRLWRPVLLAALNTDPQEASARLAAAVVRETLARGGAACRPLLASEGLAAAFIDPALAWLRQKGTGVRFDSRLRELVLGRERVERLAFADGRTITLARQDQVVLAVPAPVAQALVPRLSAPDQFRAIVNGHFRIDPPAGFPRILGVVNGLTEWLFAFEHRLAVTISGADRLLDMPREEIARTLWGEVAALTGLPSQLPPWQIIKERRATFAALPSQEAKRPGARTAWRNLLLAGDWTATGLPATIEGAVRSGNRAASLARAAAHGLDAQSHDRSTRHAA